MEIRSLERSDYKVSFLSDVHSMEVLRQFLEENPAEDLGIIIDDVGLYLPMPDHYRDSVRYPSYPSMLWTIFSGQYGLGWFSRYFFELGLVGMEFGNLLRDGPVLLGEKLLGEMENTEWYLEYGYKKSPKVSTVLCTKKMLASNMWASLMSDCQQDNPYYKTYNENLVQLMSRKEFEFDRGVFSTTRNMFANYIVEATSRERRQFKSGWGRAYVHKIKQNVETTDRRNFLVITDNGEFIDEIIDIWDSTRELDVQNLENRSVRVPPCLSFLGTFGLGHFLANQLKFSPRFRPLRIGINCTLVGAYACMGSALMTLKTLDKHFLARAKQRRALDI